MNTLERAGACASLLCDNCRLPGRCCAGFSLGRGAVGHAAHALEVLVKLASLLTALSPQGLPVGGDAAKFAPDPDDRHVMLGLPFLPLWQRDDGVWRFWCPLLGRDGRCTEYEFRPALCRSYEAGSDPLCAMHVEREAASLSTLGEMMPKETAA